MPWKIMKRLKILEVKAKKNNKKIYCDKQEGSNFYHYEICINLNVRGILCVYVKHRKQNC